MGCFDAPTGIAGRGDLAYNILNGERTMTTRQLDFWASLALALAFGVIVGIILR